VLQGAGTLGDTYVSHGLGGFYQYHGARPDTGILQLQVTADGQVVADEPALPLHPRRRLGPAPRRRDRCRCGGELA
jgi:hypothetical protein